MKAIGYIRVSTDKQDLEKQRHLLLDYAYKNKILINEFIEVEVSSQKNQKIRKIESLLEKLASGDRLLVAELSRLGRNMLETLNIINKLTESKIEITFVRQPELSTAGSHAKLLMAVYSYFAESERDFISLRTKQGLAAAKANGQLLGRPKGSKNKKSRVLDPFKDQIKQYLDLRLTVMAISKIINHQLPNPITYNAFKYFIQHEEILKETKNTNSQVKNNQYYQGLKEICV